MVERTFLARAESVTDKEGDMMLSRRRNKEEQSRGERRKTQKADLKKDETIGKYTMNNRTVQKKRTNERREEEKSASLSLFNPN